MAHTPFRAGKMLGVIAIFLAIVFAWFWQSVWLDALLASPGKAQLEKDALGFYQLAKDARPFYAASLREPLYPALLRVGLTLGRPTDEHLYVRQLTGATGLVLIAAIGALGWRLAGPVGGALAAWMFSFSSSTVHYAISGLREPLVLLLTVLLTLLLLAERRSWWWTVGLALISMALPLIRLEYLAVLPLILVGWVALAGRDGKQRVMPAALAIVLAWTLTLPFLVACQKEFGSSFALAANHATYWRNHEFAGQPGHLTREEVIANAYGGPRVTTAAYIFGDHTLPVVIGRYLNGYWISLTRHLPMIFSWGRMDNPLIWFWLAGLGWIVRHWRARGIVLWAMCLVQFPFAFIVPLDTVMPGRAHPGVEFRFSLPLTPFIAVLAAVGIVETTKWTVRAVSLRKRAPIPSSGTSQTATHVAGQ